MIWFALCVICVNVICFLVIFTALLFLPSVLIGAVYDACPVFGLTVSRHCISATPVSLVSPINMLTLFVHDFMTRHCVICFL